MSVCLLSCSTDFFFVFPFSIDFFSHISLCNTFIQIVSFVFFSHRQFYKISFNNKIIYIYIYHVAQSTRISLTLSCHPSLSSIASGKSLGRHPVSAQSCCMKVQAGRPAFARPCEGVHRRTSFMSSSLLLQLRPACLVRLAWIVLVMSRWWPYNCWFVGCCLQDL